MIISNQIKCKKCGIVIWSSHRHDFKWCPCGAVAVDGGHAYLKRSGNIEDREERSICIDDALAEAIYQEMDRLDRLPETEGLVVNGRGHANAVFRVLLDAGYTDALTALHSES